ncbi:MAG: hypothetical protein RSB04_12525 [Gordonibacter sp.]|uniref:GyrI-like domain-containing protein n=1 Tax=Gordonibacter sp. TaxID=1968902 RepID=UPI002FC77D01
MALESYDQERLAWEYLGAFVKERGIKPSDPYTEYCEFPDEGGAAEAFAGGRPEPYQEEEPMVPDGGGAAGSASRPGEPSCVVEVAVATEAQGRDEGPFRFFRSAPLPLAASIKVYGPFENIAPVYESFARWLESHPSLRMDGPTREVAHRGPWNADDPQDYLTELLIPVAELG